MSSINSLQKAQMRPGDFHLRKDDRQLFANYVEISRWSGQAGPQAYARRSASVVETPVYSEPRLWKIQIDFSAPLIGTPLSPWVPATTATPVKVTVRTALDRDKAVAVESETIFPLDLAPVGDEKHAFMARFVHGLQVGIKVEAVGAADVGTPTVIGVQASVVPVDAGERDGYGNARMLQFAQSDTSQLFLPENAHRRQFFVQNMGSAPLYVAFGELAIGPSGGGPQWTVALINTGDIYESPRDCWLGAVAGIWDSDAGAGADVAVVTEGT